MAIKAKIGDTLKDAEIDEELLETMPEIPDDVFLPDQSDEPAEVDAVMPEADDYTPEAPLMNILPRRCSCQTWGLLPRRK